MFSEPTGTQEVGPDHRIGLVLTLIGVAGLVVGGLIALVISVSG